MVSNCLIVVRKITRGRKQTGSGGGDRRRRAGTEYGRLLFGWRDPVLRPG